MRILQNDEFSYVVSREGYHAYEKNSVQILSYHGDSDNVIIPDKIDGYPVTIIGYHQKEYYEYYDNGAALYLYDGYFLDDGSLWNSESKQTNFFLKNRQKVKSITLGAYVRYIGVSAFEDCENLEEIHNTNNLKIIMKDAFKNCRNLKSIELFNKLNEIRESSFFGCESLKEIILPNSVESIGEYSFAGCNNLESLKIDNKDIVLARYAFKNCPKLSKIVYHNFDYINKYAFDYDKLYNEDGLFIIDDYLVSADNRDDLNIVLQKYNIKVIGFHAFVDCDKLTKICIPKTCELITNNAFLRCDHLNYLEIPVETDLYPNEEYPDASIFYDMICPDCLIIANRKIELLKQFDKISLITGYIYARYHNITYTSEADESYQKYIKRYHKSLIKNYPNQELLRYLIDCKLLEFKEIDNCLKIFEKNAQARSMLIEYKNSFMTEDFIKKLERQEKSRITRTLNKTSLSLSEVSKRFEVQKLASGEYALVKYYGSEYDINIPTIIGKTNVVQIGSGADRCSHFCSSIYQRIVIPEGIKIIANFCFRYLRNLREIILPQSIEIIGDYAFSDCDNLEEIIIGPNVKKIGEEAFGYCRRLKKISIENKDVEIAANAFEGSFNLLDSNGFLIINQTLFNIGNHTDNMFINNVKEIKFTGRWHNEVNNLTLSDEVVKIDKEAFAYSTMKTISLSNNLETINDGAFQYSQVKEIIIPNSVKFIGKNAFDNCSKLKKFTIEAEDLELDQHNFQNCEKLIYLIYPKIKLNHLFGFNNVIIANGYALALKENIIYSKESEDEIKTYIRRYAESLLLDKKCSNELVELILNNYRINHDIVDELLAKTKKKKLIKLINDCLENQSENLIELDYDFIQKQKEILAEEERLSKSFKKESTIICASDGNYRVVKTNSKIIIDKVDGKYITEIGRTNTSFRNGNNRSVFSYRFSDNIELNQHLRLIGRYSFYEMYRLSSIKFPPELKIIEDNAFDSCMDLVNVHFNEGLLTIGNEAFKECRSLKSVELPKSLESIGHHAFVSCKSLEKVSMSVNTKDVDASAFAGCSKLKCLIAPGILPAHFKSVEPIALANGYAMAIANNIEFDDEVLEAYSKFLKSRLKKLVDNPNISNELKAIIEKMK